MMCKGIAWRGIAALSLGMCLVAGTVSGQGSLAPPGAPAVTMKTLEQVEPRIPISTAGYEMQMPGSYYMTTNLVPASGAPAIRIMTNNVTLDLNGFSILGEGGTGNGISCNTGVDNALIRNGTICDCYCHGIYAANATHCTFQGLRILNNGRSSSTYDGINAGSQALVEECRITGNGGDGLVIDSESQAVNNQLTGNGLVGLCVIGTDSYVANNTVSGNSDNYSIADGNQLNLLICEIPETLYWSCSAKLAGTLTCSETDTNGITIAADDVTIDMDGHALIGPGTPSECGIFQVHPFSNLTVMNGKLMGWRGTLRYGIYVEGSPSRIHNLQAVTNFNGIFVRIHSVINDCSAYGNIDIGIKADYCNTMSGCIAAGNGSAGFVAYDGNLISDCVSRNNNNAGICVEHGNTISDCVSRGNNDDGIRGQDVNAISGCAVYGNSDDGIEVCDGNTISDCASRNNDNNGILTIFGNTVRGCAVSYNDDDGIEVSADNLVVGNQCDSNGNEGDGAGIQVTSGDNRIEGNNVTGNDYGIDVDAGGNFIARNTASGNATNWAVAAGNVCLVVQGVTGGSILGDSGGLAPGSTDPSANFTY